MEKWIRRFLHIRNTVVDQLIQLCVFSGYSCKRLTPESIEKAIREKPLHTQGKDYTDALDVLLESAKENNTELTMQELKVSEAQLIHYSFVLKLCSKSCLHRQTF